MSTLEFVLFSLLLSLFCSTAFSVNGKDILKFCNSTILVVDKDNQRYSAKDASTIMNQDGLCRGYITGIIESATYNRKTTQELLKNNNICLPQGVTTNQLAKVTKSYLDKHPENLHLESLKLILAALGHSFPCNSELNAAMSNINNSFNQSRELMCEAEPSPSYCTYTCIAIDSSGNEILCHWLNGESFSFKKTNESNLIKKSN